MIEKYLKILPVILGGIFYLYCFSMEELDKSLTIKSWAEEDRPREKLLSKGRHVLTDAELIAILIGSGTKKEQKI